MIGEFPKEDTITIRVHASEKQKAQNIPFTYYEIFKVGLDHLSKEIHQLEERKSVLEVKIADNQAILSENIAELTAINNRIRIIAPSRLDKDTLNQMINDAARDYAQEIYNAHGNESLIRLDGDMARHSVLETGREWGYDGNTFFNLVKKYLKELCNTGA